MQVFLHYVNQKGPHANHKGDLINENHTFKNSKDILNKFSSLLGSTYDEEIVFSCGSGVTAAVLALAYSMINNKYTPTIYDGSWAEYGKLKL